MDLIQQIKDAGVIGAGGAGFPTHAKLTSQAEFILMNAAECEPLLRVDQQLMVIESDAIIQGFAMAGRAVSAQKAIIGIKKKHTAVIAKLHERIQALGLADFVEVGLLPDVYPAGDEQVLVYELTGRVVPEAGIPIMVGCVVVNSETSLNIYNAAQGKAVTEKYITVTGDVPNPLTVCVPIGTPIIDVLRLCGINDFSNYAVIDGGPMMGPIMQDLNGYVTKKNKGFVILEKNHFLIKKKSVTMDQAKKVNKATCEQCRMCTDLCPRFLLGHNVAPHKMMVAQNYHQTDLENQKIAQLCCQCNLCELFSCPAGLHPKMANLYFKGLLAQENLRYKPEKNEFEARSMRKYRQVSSKRLIARLGLSAFDQAAPMSELTVVPQVVHILTRQHVGAPAQACVSVGDTVQKGQMIGVVPTDQLGAAIHSSINGTVTAVHADYIEVRSV